MHAETLLEIAMIHSDSLIEKAIKGNEKAQSRLVNLWFKRIYNYAFKYVSDHSIAMEVAQKTFISLYEKIGGLRSSSKFKPWLYRIATNYSYEELRKHKSLASYFVEHNEDSNNAQASGMHYNPGDKIAAEERSAFLQDAIMTLTDEQRVVIILKEYEGLKFKEIADILGESENTVKSRLYYGLKHLRKHFAAHSISKEILQL